MTGDLAYYAAVLGKPNMAGQWCTWCDLSKKEWIDVEHQKGNLWTLSLMLQHRTLIQQNQWTRAE